jgi:hypothetical protein
MPSNDQESFGVFKPVGDVVVSFPSQATAEAAAKALADSGCPAAAIRRISAAQMTAIRENDIRGASALASIGQELNLAKADLALAQRGYHWLLVSAADDDEAARVVAAVKPHGAERAQRYGRFLVEELIEHGDEQTQVAESPDRGLDAQTASGHETERVQKQRGA